MDFYGVSHPCKVGNPYNNCIDLQTNYAKLYNNFFDHKKREKLKGVFIYIEDKYVNGYMERYLHSISIDENQYDLYPCVNDESYAHCKSKCIPNKSIHCVSSINRAFCYYRLNRIKWISEVISLANKDDENIKIWSCTHYDKKGKLVVKRKVWYKNGLVSFVIIFEEKYKNNNLNLLKFITAYPVVKKSSEIKFIKEHNKWIKKK